MNSKQVDYHDLESSSILCRYKKILRIRMNHSYAGFFSYVTFVLNQLRYCEDNNLFPVVHFGPISEDGPNAFHDPNFGDNTWDYYFEPVAGLTYQDVLDRIDDDSDPLQRDDVMELDNAQLWRLHGYDPDGIHNYPYGQFRDLPLAELEDWYASQRKKARYFVSKYIQPKPHIIARVDQFWNQHFQDAEVLGIHMRGSDKGARDCRPELGRIVSPEEYFPYIDRFVEAVPVGKLFVASDQSQFVAQIVARYGEKAISQNVTRSETFGKNSNPFQLSENNSYKLGEEVLTDCLLLSRTDIMACCISAVGEYAMYFNPELLCVNLNTLVPAEDSRESSEVEKARNKIQKIIKSEEFQGHIFQQYFGKGQLFEGAIMINLDSRPDRLAKSMAELQPYCIDQWVTRMSAYRHDYASYGCARSHVEAIRYARWKGWKSVVIFEDDIKISPDFVEHAPGALSDLSHTDWGLFQFGAMGVENVEQVTENLFRHVNGHATHAYALHERSFDFIIENYVCDPNYSDIDETRHVPIDEYLNNYFTQHFDCYGSIRLLISQYPGFSNIWNTYVDYTEMIEDKYRELGSSKNDLTSQHPEPESKT